MPSTRPPYPHYGIAARKRRRSSPVRNLIAAVLFVAGILGALYIGLDIMLVGGIVGAVHAAQAHPVNVSGLAWNIVRAAFAGAAGWLIAVAGFFLAAAVAD